jgi:hypothetical protein
VCVCVQKSTLFISFAVVVAFWRAGNGLCWLAGAARAGANSARIARELLCDSRAPRSQQVALARRSLELDCDSGLSSGGSLGGAIQLCSGGRRRRSRRRRRRRRHRRRGTRRAPAGRLSIEPRKREILQATGAGRRQPVTQVGHLSWAGFASLRLAAATADRPHPTINSCQLCAVHNLLRDSEQTTTGGRQGCRRKTTTTPPTASERDREGVRAASS